MDKEKNLQKLIEKKGELEEKLHQETIREHQRINNMGWGYGMRHSKIGFSTTKSDRLRERIKKIDQQIKKIS